MAKDKNIKPIKNPNKIANYWKQEIVVIIWIVISGIIYNVGRLAGPVYQGRLIDALVAGNTLQKLLAISVEFIFVVFVVQAMRYIKRYYIRGFANDTSATMRFMLYNNVIYKKERELNNENLGSIMTKAISDVDACVEGMRKFTTEIFDTGVLLISYIVAMAIYDCKMTIIASIFTPVAFFCAQRLKKVIYQYTTAYRKKAGDISGMAYDRIDNAIVYRIYGREEDNCRKYNEELKDYEKKAVVANVWENSMPPIYNVIAIIGIVFIVVMGGRNVANGIWTIGTFSAYVAIFASMADKASRAAKLFNSVQKAQVSWRRIKPYFEEYIDEPAKKPCKEVDKTVTLNIKKLNFSYEEEKSIIRDISINAKAGDLIGVTGTVACGKSTFGKLFLGEYAYTGNIELSGRELSDYSDRERSEMIAYMGHNPHLISDTIYNNITLGDKGDISEVLRIVCFDKDMENMPQGVETIVGNGGIKLSGGQQARIALARTLYHQKKLIILDDPFSAVDMETEGKIIENLQNRYSDSIIIIISHRFSVFKKMDNIIMMNEQGDYQYGNHEALLENSPTYKELYELQNCQ